MKSSGGNSWQKPLDSIGLFLIVGVLKFGDEIGTHVKGTKKASMRPELPSSNRSHMREDIVLYQKEYTRA